MDKNDPRIAKKMVISELRTLWSNVSILREMLKFFHWSKEDNQKFMRLKEEDERRMNNR